MAGKLDALIEGDDTVIEYVTSSVIFYAIPGCVLLFFALFSSIAWCVCACCRIHSGTVDKKQPFKIHWFACACLFVVLSMLVIIIITSIETRDKVQSLTDDVRSLATHIIDRIDLISISITEIRTMGSSLPIDSYLNGNNILASMQIEFDEEKQQLPVGFDVSILSDIQSYIDGIIKVADRLRIELNIERQPDIFNAINDALNQLQNGRDTIDEQMTEDAILHKVDSMNTRWTIWALIFLPVVSTLLVAGTTFSSNEQCCSCPWSLGQFATPLIVCIAIISLVFLPLSAVLTDGCDYITYKENTWLVSNGETNAQKIGHACINQLNLLDPFDVNITKLVDKNQWLENYTPDQMPNLDVFVETYKVTFNATRRAIEQSVDLLLEAPIVLDPLIAFVHATVNLATCGAIVPVIYQIRDRVCILPDLFMRIGIFMTVFGIMAVMVVSFRSCNRTHKNGYKKAPT